MAATSRYIDRHIDLINMGDWTVAKHVPTYDPPATTDMILYKNKVIAIVAAGTLTKPAYVSGANSKKRDATGKYSLKSIIPLYLNAPPKYPYIEMDISDESHKDLLEFIPSQVLNAVGINKERAFSQLKILNEIQKRHPSKDPIPKKRARTTPVKQRCNAIDKHTGFKYAYVTRPAEKACLWITYAPTWREALKQLDEDIRERGGSRKDYELVRVDDKYYKKIDDQSIRDIWLPDWSCRKRIRGVMTYFG